MECVIAKRDIDVAWHQRGSKRGTEALIIDLGENSYAKTLKEVSGKLGTIEEARLIQAISKNRQDSGRIDSQRVRMAGRSNKSSVIYMGGMDLITTA
ncbi:hypothetical protein HHI36_001331 [Cryptolaemus montrouzieri]|uniref:Uncharacterized protein n=1 Tax=Cryptolaemus montrouzieri TaxID=559131 RepID=A0ABD2P808_9CUCU